MMKIDDFLKNSEARPVIALFLCTCIALSSAAPYEPVRPVTADTAATETTVAEGTEAETVFETSADSESTVEETTAEEPAPYRLNLASMYGEGEERSYGEILMEELIRKDSQWYAEIYDMAGTTPSVLARRFGRKPASVLGQYNPASKNHEKSNPATWAVEHFKNVKVSFSSGSGNANSAVSNAQDILSMASVYAYYNHIEDLDSIRSYVNSLWRASHSYSASMGDVYYCNGCVSPDAVHSGEEEDSELSGEDTFRADSSIDTEILTTETEAGEEAESASESASETLSETGSKDHSRNEAAVPGDGTETSPSQTTTARETQEWESTTSVLDSIAETAESIYVEETTRRALIVRPEETTSETVSRRPGMETEASSPSQTTAAPETSPQTSAPESLSATPETPSQTVVPDSVPAPDSAPAPDSVPAMPEAVSQTIARNCVSAMPEAASQTIARNRVSAMPEAASQITARNIVSAENSSQSAIKQVFPEESDSTYQVQAASTSSKAVIVRVPAETQAAGEAENKNPAAEKTNASETKSAVNPSENTAVLAETTAASSETTGAVTEKVASSLETTDAVTEKAASSLGTAASVIEPPASSLNPPASTPEASVSGTENTGKPESLPAPKICPGHIDLKISAKIHTLDENDSFFEIDQKGNHLEEGSEWPGWNSQSMAYARHIARQDWTETYGLNIVVEGTRAPLSNTEIESYLKLLPEGTSQVRTDIIRFALQSVGKIPYYWGGKPNASNYSGNHFGSVTIPDHRGRILKGLDCSGWINWVYWSVTGNRLPYEGTDGLRTMGRQIARKDLKPGDIIVITGNTPHVIMFLSWTESGQIQCIHETGSANNVTVGILNANWPYYRNLLD